MMTDLNKKDKTGLKDQVKLIIKKAERSIKSAKI